MWRWWLVTTIYTCHHHFWKWWWLSPPLFPYTLGKKIVFFFLPEAFCGLKYAENAIAAGAPPRTLLGELTTLPRPSNRLGEADTPPDTPPQSAPQCSRLRRPIVVPPDTKSWWRQWSPPLFKLKLRQCFIRHLMRLAVVQSSVKSATVQAVNPELVTRGVWQAYHPTSLWLYQSECGASLI